MDKEDTIHASVAAEPEEEERKSLACSIIVQEVVSDSEEVQTITDDTQPKEEQDS